MLNHNHNHHEHDDESNHNNLSTDRLEAFSDGVLAIIITITVLEFKIPQGAEWQDLSSLIPLFVAYLISFQTIGTYWNNHHHLLKVTKHVSTSIMWANLHLLFWLSLIPFSTGWLGENHGSSVPTALYSAILFLSGFAYSLLQWRVIIHSEKRHELMKEFSESKKSIISLTSYALAFVFAFYQPIISDILIVLITLLWFVPDRRIEKYL
jgi:uncharacterized membrane protein